MNKKSGKHHRLFFYVFELFCGGFHRKRKKPTSMTYRVGRNAVNILSFV